ncbi:hypothetical protein HMPREF1869_01041 [Bacteroidales bacterium KA00251]|nr:hypothetical protein HMPREF1869_01041 [Bacteroidales bacterium KA00251]
MRCRESFATSRSVSTMRRREAFFLLKRSVCEVFLSPIQIE